MADYLSDNNYNYLKMNFLFLVNSIDDEQFMLVRPTEFFDHPEDYSFSILAVATWGTYGKEKLTNFSQIVT